MTCHLGDTRGLRPAPARDPGPGGLAGAGRVPRSAAARRPGPWNGFGPGMWSWCPPAGAAAWPSSSTTAVGTRRRPAADRPDRRPPGEAAVPGGLPASRRAARAGQGARARSTPAHRRRAGTSRPACVTPASKPEPPGRTASAPRPPMMPGSPSCAGRCGPTPSTAAPSARTICAGPSAGCGCAGTPTFWNAGSRGGPTRSPERSTGCARCWPSWATWPATGSLRRTAAVPGLQRSRPARGRVPARGHLG